VTINFPVSATYMPTSPTTRRSLVVTANGSIHTAIVGNNGSYTLKPLPPYAGIITSNPPVAITTASLPNWTAGIGYNQTLSASGGNRRVDLHRDRDLPTGLTLSSAGVLSGTPTAAGNSTFTVTAATPWVPAPAGATP